jgi:cyclopropane-fatty-acyl-phospholipid synthase
MNETSASRAELGTSQQVARSGDDLDSRFFSLFLDRSLGDSSGMWLGEGGDSSFGADTIDAAQERNVDWFAERLCVDDDVRLLDIGCGWGGPLARLVESRGLADAVGLTLSPAQARFAAARGLAGVDVRVEGWQTHRPDRPYDVIVSFEAFERFARDGLSRDDKVPVYSTFFERCAEWLNPGGHLGLQTVCFESTGEVSARPGRGAVADVLRTDLFPGATPAHLPELCVAWEPVFELDHVTSEPLDHVRTYRAWLLKLRANRTEIERLVGRERYLEFWQYLDATEALFRTEEWSVYRIHLSKRRRRKI